MISPKNVAATCQDFNRSVENVLSYFIIIIIVLKQVLLFLSSVTMTLVK